MASPSQKQAPSGGTGGLTLAHTLHQIGEPCWVLEAVPTWVDGHGPAGLRPEAVQGHLGPVLRNRGSRPFAILGRVDEGCGGVFDNIEDVTPKAERDEFMARYKQVAGLAMEALNGAAPIIGAGRGSSKGKCGARL